MVDYDALTRDATLELLNEEHAAVTRGSRTLPVLALRNRHGCQAAFERAAARQRLLHARYPGWSATSGRGTTLIADGGYSGPFDERTCSVRSALDSGGISARRAPRLVAAGAA